MTDAEMTAAIKAAATHRNVRVRAANGPRFAELLREAGFLAVWRGPGTACIFTTVAWECERHEAYYIPLAWGSILTTASGRQAHRVWAEAGVVPR